MSRRRALVLVAVVLALLGWCALKLRLGTDITRFMPDRSRSELAALSSRLTASPITRTMVLSLGASETGTAVAAARELAEALRRHPEVAWVRSALDEAQLRDVYELYFPRRHLFMSDEPERAIPPLLEDAALRKRARQLRQQLASPASALLEPLASADPLGSFQRVAERFRGGEPALRIEQGQFVTLDGRHAIVLLGTRAPAFSSGPQGRLLAFVDETFGGIERRLGGELQLELSGANRFAVAAEQSLKRDIYWIGGSAFIGVGIVFWLLVGSLRSFLIVSIPPLVGILVATALGLLVFGELDGLTMAFGASLMGIAVDYSNHLLIHHGLAAGESPGETVRRIRPSLVLGALTTVASFGGLALTAFPAFREMSFFATVGVLTALLVSLEVLPSLLPSASKLPPRSVAVAARLGRVLGGLSRVPFVLTGAAAAGSLLALFALPQLEWTDDMSRLTSFDPRLLEEDRRVRQRVARLDSGRFVIGLAPDAGAALALSDRIHRRLQRVVDAGELDGTRSLHALLWSEELQRRNQAVLSADPGLYRRVDEAFASEGFRRGAFREFAAALAAPPAPLTLAELEASPLADLLAPFVFPLGDELAVVTYLRGVRSVEAVHSALDGLEGVRLLDQRSFVNDVYREFRETTLRQMLVGGALVVGLLALRYRAWRPVAAAFLPSLLVALLLLAILALAGVPATLLHIMSLIMVMGMGVDYGVFLVDSRAGRAEAGATMLSLLVSCLTTACVFGTLALSSQPALRAIGITTGVGILLAYVLAPVALAAAGLFEPAESP